MLKDFLKILSDIAKENRLRTPYIVGGIPRDILLGNLSEINDIDITTGSKDVDSLAELFAQKLNTTTREMKDGHKKVMKDGISFDFSSNFMYDNIDEFLTAKGIVHSSDLIKETYSRDFTINTLLIPLNFGQVFDLTGMGKRDIEAGIIRCPVDCNLSFKNSPIRIIRAFYYSARFGFKIADDVKEAIKNNLDLIPKIERQYVVEKINYIVREKPELLTELMELGVLDKVPMTKALSRALIKSRKLLDVL